MGSKDELVWGEQRTFSTWRGWKGKWNRKKNGEGES